MANNRVKINCDIDADIGQAKKAISDLQRSIEKLSKAQINTNYLDKGINNAVAAAKELQHHLNAALNQNTGKLNLNAFTSSLEQSNISAKDLMQTLLQGGSAGQQTFASLANAIAQSEVPLRRANKTLQDFATTLKNTVKWEISSTMVHGLESALSGAVSYAKNLNTSLTNIRIVTGQSVDDMARFAKEANVAAKALSTTTKSYADASLIYYQQGDSQELAAKKAAITIKAANSSFETSAKEMSEYLTSVWNSYQVGADELERYVDIMANLGAKTATSLEEIATSMQKVAATANTVGVSMEQVSSIIATVSSVTRESAESIGTSYKTIFARIGDLKLGKVDEDGVGLGQVSSQLDAIGVKILDESGNLREMGDIIIDLGTKWQTMNQAQKTAVAQVVAGKRQYTQLMALFENWDMFQGNMNIAENSEGALQKMADTYAESWEAASARVQASMEGIYNKILNDQAIITITKGMADLIGAVDTLIERLGGMSGMLSTLGGIGINVFSKQIAGGINKTVSSLKTYFSQFSGFGDFVSKGKNGQILNNEQINYQKSLADWDKAIDEVKSKQGEGSPEALALQNSKDLLDMKQQLINAEYSLSDAEKSRAQNLLAQISSEQAHLLELSQQKKQIAQQEKQQETRYLQQLSNRTVDEAQRKTLPIEYRKEVAEYKKTSERTASIGSAISSLERIKTEGTDVVVKEIERLKSVLGESLPAKIFDDFNGDVDALIQDLQKAQDKSIETAATIATRFKQDKTSEQQEIIDNLFSDIDDTSSTKIDLKLETAGATDVLDNIKGKFNSLFGKDSKLMNSLGDKLTAAAGTLASMQGGFESGASWIEVWNDETAGFGDHLAAASGILTNLASGFAAGGPWGLALTAVMAIVGGIIQAAEEAEKAYQEAQQADFDRMKEDTSKKDAELSNIQNLMKNYNSLKETYDTTGQGQEALAASARELAEAYGLVGANVLIAEGNFAAFEQMIAQSTGLKGIENFYQGKINALMADINDDDTYSQYAINSKDFDGIFTEDYRKQYNQIDFNNDDYINSRLDYELEHNTAGYETANKALADATTELTENTQRYNDLIVQQAQLSTKIQTDERGEAWTKNFNSSAIKEAGWLSDKRHFFDDDIVKANKDIESYFSDLSIFGDTNETVQKLQTKFKDLLGKDNILNDSEIKDFISQIEQARIDLVKSLLDGTEKSLNEVDGLLSEDKQKEAQAEIDKLKESAKTSIAGQYAEQLRAASGLEGNDTEYYDYFTGLLDENERLNFDNSNKIDWYRQVQENLELLTKEKTNVQAAIDAKPGAEMEKALQSRLDDLIEIEKILKDLNNEKLAEAIAQIDDWEDSKNRAKIINTTISQLIGKNEKNTTFSVFDAWIKALERDIEETALADERFKDLIKADSSAENGYKIIEGKEKEFQELRNQIVSGYIADFTAFDDYLSVYKILAESFNNSGEYQKARDYINSKEIKNARLVNSRLIQAMQEDLKNGNIGNKTEGVLAYNQQVLDSEKTVSTYQNMDQLANTYKDNLDYDEAFALQEQLLADGDIAWESFIQMDGDARKAYLESRKQAALDAAIIAQKELAKNAGDKQKEVYATEEEYNKDKKLLSIFDSNFRKNQNGEYEYINDPNIKATKEAVGYYEGLREKTQSYDTYGKEKENAEGAANALEIINSDGERAIDKINRMKNAISELPKDMEEFNKLVKQLGNIEPKKLVEMSDLERAKLILSDLQKPTEAQFTTIDPKTQKEVFNAAGYAKAMQAYVEARQSAANVILESANAAFTQIENRMTQARKEAEKTKTIAETLSGAVQTGELTETQKLGMDANLLTNWEAASNAVERGAIAAQQWANYGVKISEASEDMVTAYNRAETSLDRFINSKTYRQTDLLAFNFSDKETGKTSFVDFIRRQINDPALQDIWNKGFESLISHTDISNMSDIGILEAVKKEIEKTGNITQEELDQILAGVKDSIINTYSTLGEQEASLAQQVVNEWESAFKQIANLRRSIIMGDDIGSDLTNSLSDYVRYANAYTGKGSLAEAYKNGSLKSEQLALGTGQELTEKLLASMGLRDDTDQNNYYDLFGLIGDKVALKSLDSLAAEFGIQREDAQFKDEQGNFNFDLYEKSVKEAVTPFLRTLLENSGLDSNTIEARLQEFLNGSITAEQTINEAANKMLGLASEYATLLDSNQQLAEADAKFKATQEEQTKIQTEAQNYANVTESIMELKPEDRNAGKIAEVLSNAGISSTDYISSMRDKGFGVSSLNDIANLSNESLERYENYLQQDALKAGQTIVSAAQEFKSIVTNSQEEGGLGYGEDSIAGETATKYLEEATNNQNSNIDAYVADTQMDMSSSIDTSLSMAGEQLGALQALDKVKQGTSEWSQGLDELYNAYSHLEGAGEIIDKLADGTINLNEANDQLVDLTLKATDNVYDFSDAQWDLYKKTLRTNKVVVDGYESLEDYFDAIEDGRKESKKWISEGKKFNKQLEDQKDNLDENKDGMLDYSEAADIVQKEWENLFKDGLIDEDTFEDGKRIMGEGVQGILDEANRIIDAHPEYDFTEGLRQAVLNYSGESAQCLADLAIMMGASADECLRLAAENSVVALQDLIVDMLGQGTLNWGNIPQLVAQINAWMSANGIAGKRLTSPSGGSRGGSGGGSRRPSSGGSGGGGGGDKQKETKELVRYKDEVERYHVQNETLERISENLDEIDKLKERAYGADHIAQIDAETNALNEQLIAQQALHDEALKWMAADKADLSVYGAEFDDEGTIINYETVMKRIIDEYNAAIERYNNSGQGDGDKLALEAAEQRFEDAKKAIENYEEAVQIANDSTNEMLEIQNKMSELEVEKITYELELKMEMNERDLEMLEYYQEKYSEELENQDKLFNTFIQSAAEYEDNLAQLGKAYEDLSRQYAAGLINEAHYAEAVTELQEEIVDNLNSLQEIQSELAEAYSETLELAREEIERTTDAIDHSNEALQSFMDITRLTGNDAEYKKIGKFYDQMYANNLTKIEVQKAHLDSLLEEEERFQEKIRNGQQLTELEKAEYVALSEQIQETRDTLLSSVVESLEVVRESYENTINSIADDLDNFMAGAAGSMEYLQEQYGYFQEEQERYVSTTKELYEVSKLNREIEGTLATTTSSAAKEALKALQEKINKQSELNELTEYDIEMNQLQYQLLLARIKLEESQNAKDTVRLTRDENGNYAYRYTANQDKIDEAAQHYEDVLQQINDTTVQRTSEIEQQLLNTMSNYKEKFQEIATDYSLTEEERLMRLEELNNQFSETMRYLQEQNNIVTNNLTANQEAIAGHYGATMSEITASTAGNVNNTIQSMIDKTEEYIAAMNNAIFGEEGAQSAWQKYLAQLGDIEGSADVAYDSLLGSTQEMGEMNGFAAEEALEVIQTLRDTLDPLEALSSAWDAHNAILEATISNYENLAQVIQGALSAIGQIPNGGTANVDGAHRYAKGGLVDYTGLAWVDGTASDPEMMLNPGDTQNILKATAMVKSLDSGFIGSLVESVKSAAAAMLHMFGGAYHAVTNVHTANDSALDQNVHITAEFPNVQNHTEIEEAFDNLINQAAQFAHRKN